jgi:secreted trypsin-like serine protease
MKNALLIPVLFLLSISVFSQKVRIQIIKVDQSAKSEWQIYDEQDLLTVSGSDFNTGDSIFFSLEANKKYSLKISVSEVFKPDSTLYLLLHENEPIILINSDIGTGEHVYPFYTGIRTRDTKITGGVTGLISDFPWQVYYLSGNFRCGGSIISPDWVVTAAHCTKDDSGNPIPVASMSVKVGSNNPGNSANLNNTVDGKRYFVSQVIVHEGYNSQTNANDIALLKISGPINYPNATPIKLVTATDVTNGAILPGVMSWVTGYGLINVSPNVLPTSLQKVQLPIVSSLQASAVWGTIPSSDLMAGYLNGNKDACSGDSGGPLTVPVLGEYKLAGIVSWGSSNCNTYGAYTRVSDFNSWISTKTGISTYIPPVPVGDSIVCQGVLVSQYSIANVTGATTYEWRLYPADAGVITGSSASASVLWNLSKTGSVAVMVRVTINNVVSDWSNLKVNVVTNTRLLSQSKDTALCAGNPVSLKVGAEGYKLTFNWFQDNLLVQSGSSPQISFIRSAAVNSGMYKCQISGSCGTLTSIPAKLTVYQLTKITFISPDVEVPFGNDISLTVKSEGNNLKYQWEKDNQYLVNRNDSVITLHNVNATDIGLYKTIVNGTCGTKTSDSIYVYVKKDNASTETDIFVWPTISTASFNVALSNDALYNISIYNSMGNLLKMKTECRYQTVIDIGTFGRGIYFINVFNNTFRKSIKIFKE